MCLQYSPPVEDTLFVTFWAKSLNESWCQTQYYGYTNFECSMSQSHLPATAVALKHQEYSHTFYRVTPNIHIIYTMGNDCLCCLFLVAVYIILMSVYRIGTLASLFDDYTFIVTWIMQIRDFTESMYHHDHIVSDNRQLYCLFNSLSRLTKTKTSKLGITVRL